jgi:hypothetical protein
MLDVKIIQLTPVTFPTWVVWTPTDSDTPKTDKPHYERVVLWALVEHKDGDTRVYGMTCDDGGTEGMGLCEEITNFGGYTYKDPEYT